MDNKQIRAQNFRALMAGFEKDADFADYIGMSPGQVSLIKNGHNRIGDSIARKVERAFSKPPGWMDTHHSEYAANNIRLATVNESPIEYQENPISTEDIARILSIIYRGIGADVFFAAPIEEQTNIIKSVRAYLADDELAEISDNGIAKIIRMGNHDKGTKTD